MNCTNHEEKVKDTIQAVNYEEDVIGADVVLDVIHEEEDSTLNDKVENDKVI